MRFKLLVLNTVLFTVNINVCVKEIQQALEVPSTVVIMLCLWIEYLFLLYEGALHKGGVLQVHW